MSQAEFQQDPGDQSDQDLRLRASVSQESHESHQSQQTKQSYRSQKHIAPNGETTTSTVTTTKTRRNLLYWDDLAPWQRDNHYIHSGYRPATNSYASCLHSLCYFQNESINIYTHLLSALLTFPIAYWLYDAITFRYPTANTADTAVFACFFVGSAFCFTMSATYHTISCHSAIIARKANALDYLGIVGLITGSFIPSIFYGFYCRPDLQHLYWGMICSLGMACAVVTSIQRFRTPEWRKFRAVLFVCMGLSGFVPITHWVLDKGISQVRQDTGLDWLILQGALYILGAFIYASRIPEKWYPGRFDLVGHSHQIFHVLVILAAVAHLRGLIVAFDYWHGPDGGSKTCSL